MTDVQTRVGRLALLDLARHGDRTAVVHADGTLTYAELSARVDALRARLGEQRRLVVVHASTDLGSLVAYLAALAGGHAVLLAPGDRPDAAADLLRVYAPDVVLRSTGQGVDVDERRPGTGHDLHPDLALLLSTSGSTGSPKLVRLSPDNLQSNAEAIVAALGVRPDDRAATTLPFHYCYGLSVVHSHLLVGAALVLTTQSVVDPCFWDVVRRAGVTTFAAVPYTFELLDRVGFADLDVPTLRYVTQAGGRLAPDAVRRWAEVGRARGWDLVVMYGQTEATARMAYLPPALATERPEAVGVAVAGGSFRIDVTPGRTRHDDEVGELVYTGPNVMLGYATGPTDLALGRTVHELRTGDLARIAADGLVEVVGRRSRYVKVVGLRVDLGEVERVLADLGLTALAAGEDEHLAIAVEASADSLDTGLIGAVLAERLGVPRRSVVVRSVTALPRTDSGKPCYTTVLALAGDDRRAAPGSTLATTPIPAPTPAPAATPGPPSDVRRILAEETGHAVVGDDATFVSLGGDSLSYVATSVRLEGALGHLPRDWDTTPVRDLIGRAEPAPGRWRRLRPRPVETTIALRAIAILLIVATHAHLVAIPGTAHVLVAVAGANLARFQLAGERTARVRRQLRSIARVVVPSVAFIAVAALLTGRYTWHNVLLLNAALGPPTWTPQWHFWFVEMLVYVLVGVALLLATPWGDRAERRFPLGFPAALLAVGLVDRFELVAFPAPHPAPVLWLFALGWAFARARAGWHRVVLSGVVLLAVPGFFGNPDREVVLAVGLLALAWLPTVPLPPALHRPLGVLASASLYIYLTHWLVYPPLAAVHPALGVLGSVAAGVAYWLLVRWVSRGAGRRQPVVTGPIWTTSKALPGTSLRVLSWSSSQRASGVPETYQSEPLSARIIP